MENEIYKYVKKHNPCYQNEAGKELGILQGTLSKYLCRLEKDGKIRREDVLISCIENNIFKGTYERNKKTKQIFFVK